MNVERLAAQIGFLLELDKAKRVGRQTWLTDESRKENDAEHMWHLALFVLVLAEHAAEPVDVAKVLKMVLLHDIVEIDAGDTYIYDEVAKATQAEREERAADRIYGLLPDDQAAELRVLWDEFEARVSPEAKFAASVDRLQPLVLNLATRGRAWKEHQMTSDRVIAVNRRIEEGSPALWAYASDLIEDAVERGYLDPPPGD